MDSSDKPLDIVRQFAKVLGIKDEEAKTILAALTFEEYYDLLDDLQTGNVDKIIQLHHRYHQEKHEDSDKLFKSFSDIWHSSDTPEIKRSKLIDLFSGIDQSKFLSFGKKLLKTKKIIPQFSNLIFDKFPEQKNLKDVLLKIFDFIKGNGSASLAEARKKPGVKNPAAHALGQKQFQAKKTKTKREKSKQADPYGRKSKHKEKAETIDEFKLGEKLQINGRLLEIKIPNGPDGTVGVLLDGRLEMVNKSEISEGVLGIAPMPSVIRLRELAGLDDKPAGLPVPVDHPMEPMVQEVPTQSPEFQQAMAMLDGLKAVVENLRVSEYRTFVDFMKNLTHEIEDMGHSLLD